MVTAKGSGGASRGHPERVVLPVSRARPGARYELLEAYPGAERGDPAEATRYGGRARGTRPGHRQPLHRGEVRKARLYITRGDLRNSLPLEGRRNISCKPAFSSEEEEESRPVDFIRGQIFPACSSGTSSCHNIMAVSMKDRGLWASPSLCLSAPPASLGGCGGGGGENGREKARWVPSLLALGWFVTIKRGRQAGR